MGLHPVRWFQGGTLTGSESPPLCLDCTAYLGPEPCDIYCPGCRAGRNQAEAEREAERQRQAEEDGGLYWGEGWWNYD